MKLSSALLAAALATVPIVCASEARAATISVTTDADTVAIDGKCTLREAVISANTNPASAVPPLPPPPPGECVYGESSVTAVDLIKVPDGHYKLSLVGANEDMAATGDLDIQDNVEIRGTSRDGTIIDGILADRIFDVQISPVGPGFSLSLSNLSLIMGKAQVSPVPGEVCSEMGGAICVRKTMVMPYSNLSLHGVKVERNFAKNGAGLYVLNGQTIIKDSLVDGNQASDLAGGIWFEGNTLEIVISSIESNKAQAYGGIFGGDATKVTIMNSLIANNNADGPGLGIAGGMAFNGGAGGTCNIFNSTLSGNTAVNDGGGYAHLSGTSYMSYVTLTGNKAGTSGAGEGGGVANMGVGGMKIKATIIAGNEDLSPLPNNYPDIKGNLDLNKYNIIGIKDGSTLTNPFPSDNLVGTGSAPVLALLDPLVNLGGTTSVHALKPASPARDFSEAATCVDLATNSGLSHDQRGTAPYTRPKGPKCDAGAMEADYIPPPPVPPPPVPPPLAPPSSGGGSTIVPPATGTSMTPTGTEPAGGAPTTSGSNSDSASPGSGQGGGCACTLCHGEKI